MKSPRRVNAGACLLRGLEGSGGEAVRGQVTGRRLGPAVLQPGSGQFGGGLGEPSQCFAPAIGEDAKESLAADLLERTRARACSALATASPSISNTSFRSSGLSGMDTDFMGFLFGVRSRSRSLIIIYWGMQKGRHGFPGRPACGFNCFADDYLAGVAFCAAECRTDQRATTALHGFMTRHRPPLRGHRGGQLIWHRENRGEPSIINGKTPLHCRRPAGHCAYPHIRVPRP